MGPSPTTTSTSTDPHRRRRWTAISATAFCVAFSSGCDIGIAVDEGVFTIENDTNQAIVVELLDTDEEPTELPERRNIVQFFVPREGACLGSDAVVRDPETDEVLARYGEPGCGGETWIVKPVDLSP